MHLSARRNPTRSTTRCLNQLFVEEILRGRSAGVAASGHTHPRIARVRDATPASFFRAQSATRTSARPGEDVDATRARGIVGNVEGRFWRRIGAIVSVSRRRLKNTAPQPARCFPP